MAQLNWLHNYDTDITSLDIDNIRYETVDGGQNIYKYVDGELEKRIRQFPEEADDYLWEYNEEERFKECPHDEWGREMNWLVETYTDITGPLHLDVTAYKDDAGNLVEHGRTLGYGANNLDELIPVNRMLIPASIQERWGYTLLADSEETQENAPEGLEWVQDKETKKIYRIGKLQCYPCHVFPKVYKPVEISHIDFNDDVESFNGRFV
jgi:hypothetical protein